MVTSWSHMVAVSLHQGLSALHRLEAPSPGWHRSFAMWGLQMRLGMEFVAGREPNT